MSTIDIFTSIVFLLGGVLFVYLGRRTKKDLKDRALIRKQLNSIEASKHKQQVIEEMQGLDKRTKKMININFIIFWIALPIVAFLTIMSILAHQFFFAVFSLIYIAGLHYNHTIEKQWIYEVEQKPFKN